MGQLDAIMRELYDVLYEFVATVSSDVIGIATVCAHTESVLGQYKKTRALLASREHTAIPPSTDIEPDVGFSDVALERLLAKARRAVTPETAVTQQTTARSNEKNSVTSKYRGSGVQSHSSGPASRCRRQEPDLPDVCAAGDTRGDIGLQINSKAPRPPLPFDETKWREWRRARAEFSAGLSAEPAARTALLSARSAWRQQLDSSARVPTDRSSRGVFPHACAVSRLCQMAVTDILPEPSRFLETISRKPDSELAGLFPLMALTTWLSKLLAAAERTVYGARQAIAALRRAGDLQLPAHPDTKAPQSASLSCGAELPPSLLSCLPGGEAGARAVALASNRARYFEAEREVATRCAQLAEEASALLGAAQVGGAVPVEALYALRLAAHMASEERTLAGVWPVSSYSGSEA